MDSEPEAWTRVVRAPLQHHGTIYLLVHDQHLEVAAVADVSAWVHGKL